MGETETRSRKWGLATGSVTDGLRSENDLSPWSHEEIARARAICDAATGGPWGRDSTGLIHARPGEHGPIFCSEPDADFIAVARSLLPAALYQIEYLQRRESCLLGERDELRGRVGNLEAALAAEADRDYKEIAEATIAAQAKRIVALVEEARSLNATITGQAQEIGRLRGTDPGIEIAPGVRLVWQRGNVGVLTFEPGAVVPEESHELAEAGVVIGGTVVIDGARWDVSLDRWCVPAGRAHTMTAGPEGAIVGVRWIGEGGGSLAPAPAPAPPPFAAYMPVDGLSTEALADGLRALASSALRRAEASGRVKGIKITVITEGLADATTGTFSVVRDLAGGPAALVERGWIR